MTFSIQDIETIECEHDSEEQYFASIQRAINAGTPWQFQGSYGRAMMDAIDAGRCMLGTSHARDYWGNRIPSRDEVKEGTKGSVEYVRANSGDDWADLMLSI
mgnify:CR=1 FL=1